MADKGKTRGPPPIIAEQQLGSVRLHDTIRFAPARLIEIDATPPAMPLVADAVITRMQLDRPVAQAVHGDPAQRSGTVYDGAGLPVPINAVGWGNPLRRLVMTADEAVLAEDRRRAATHLPGRHLYAGDWKPHFGHFMLESLCRAWAFDARPRGGKLIFHGGRLRPARAVRPFMLDLLRPLGIGRDDLLIGDRDLRVDELVVPDSAYDLPVRARPGFVEPFARIAAAYGPPDPAAPRRLYFTRRNVTETALARLADAPPPPRVLGRTLAKMAENEAEVERAFERRGFVVVAPETLPLPAQVALAAGAEMLAGLTGTALHHALFCPPGARILSVATRTARNQMALEQMRGLAADHLFCAPAPEPDRPVRIDVGHLEALLDRVGVH